MIILVNTRCYERKLLIADSLGGRGTIIVWALNKGRNSMTILCHIGIDEVMLGLGSLDFDDVYVKVLTSYGVGYVSPVYVKQL